MCSAFLWSGSPHTSSKAKVAWEDLCTPKREGSLGVRRMHDVSTVFSLKLIWRLFEEAGPLWVAWTRCYLLRDNSFWDISANTTRGSWMWKKLLKLWPIAATFLKSEMRDEKSTSFWFENWLSVGPLIHITEEVGTRILGVSHNAKVTDTVEGKNWRIRRTRGLHLQDIIRQIIQAPPPTSSTGSDRMLWLQGHDKYEKKFSSRCTWERIRQAHQAVSWNRIVWFPQAIPRQAFIMWLAFRSRLSTGDRMRQWGENQSCMLCGEPNETRDHLFFACPFSYTLWTILTSTLLESRINPYWNMTVNSLTGNQLSKLDFNSG